MKLGNAISVQAGGTKIMHQTQGFFKKSTLGNIGRLDNKKICKI